MLKTTKSLTLTSFVVAKPISLVISKSDFEDLDGDSFTLSCSDSYEWLDVSSNGDNYIITGTSPSSNTA